MYGVYQEKTYSYKACIVLCLTQVTRNRRKHQEAEQVAREAEEDLRSLVRQRESEIESLTRRRVTPKVDRCCSIARRRFQDFLVRPTKPTEVSTWKWYYVRIRTRDAHGQAVRPRHLIAACGAVREESRRVVYPHTPS